MSHTAEQALAIARLHFRDRAHVIEGGRRLSFAALDASADEAAARFRRAGLERGARMAVRVPNSFAGLAAVFGVWRAGGVFVPVNPRLTAAEEETIVRESGARLRASLDARGQLVVEPAPGGGGPADPGLAAIAFTSGTSGKPKGVEITHENLLWAAAAVVHTRRDTRDAVALVVSPICHLPIFVSHYLARLLSGGTVVIGAFDADRLAATVEEEGVTDLPLVPAMVGPLLERSARGGAARLRKVTVGSALTPMEVKGALHERFPQAEIIEAYGQTESTDGLTMTVGREALERPGTVGRAHALVALRVVDRDDRPVPAGEQGEIVCRGPVVMRGYRGNPEATAAALRGGWLHTGDLGRMDADGFLYITGRLKEIIISGGENVSPEEVEAALATHPAVVEAAVFGLPHARWGEEVAAAVVSREPVSTEALSEHLAARLARFKQPRRIWFVADLPKTAAGKVRRALLRERYQRS